MHDEGLPTRFPLARSPPACWPRLPRRIRQDRQGPLGPSNPTTPSTPIPRTALGRFSANIRKKFGVVQTRGARYVTWSAPAGPGQQEARLPLALHRPGHRRGQRLRCPRRLHPHHQGLSGADRQRVGAGRRARPRAGPRHRGPHGEGAVEGRFRRHRRLGQRRRRHHRRPGNQVTSKLCRASAAARSSNRTRTACRSPPRPAMRPAACAPSCSG